MSATGSCRAAWLLATESACCSWWPLMARTAKPPGCMSNALLPFIAPPCPTRRTLAVKKLLLLLLLCRILLLPVTRAEAAAVPGAATRVGAPSALPATTAAVLRGLAAAIAADTMVDAPPRR